MGHGVPEIVMVRIQNMRVQSFLTAAAINLKRLARNFANGPRKPGSHQTPRWRKTDSNCRSLSRECRRTYRSIRVVKTGHPHSRGTIGSNLLPSTSEPCPAVPCAAELGAGGRPSQRKCDDVPR